MSDVERLDERLTAVEQTVVDGDYELAELEDLAAAVDDLERIERRLDDIESRLADLESRSQAVEGFVGNVRSVNDEVEQRADTAIAVVDRLEERVETLEGIANVDPHANGGGTSGGHDGSADPTDRADEVFAAAGDGTAAANGDTPGGSRTLAGSQSGRRGATSSISADGDGSGDAGRPDADADQASVEKNFTPSDAEDEDGGLLASLKRLLSS